MPLLVLALALALDPSPLPKLDVVGSNPIARCYKDLQTLASFMALSKTHLAPSRTPFTTSSSSETTSLIEHALISPDVQLTSQVA
jgi:hypothetical protein